jgi:phage terminase large subunit GpA-like protein
MIRTYKRGIAQYVWRLKEGGTKRNEPLDCRNYAQAALEISGVVLKKTERAETSGAPAKKRGRGVRGTGV